MSRSTISTFKLFETSTCNEVVPEGVCFKEGLESMSNTIHAGRVELPNGGWIEICGEFHPLDLSSGQQRLISRMAALIEELECSLMELPLPKLHARKQSRNASCT